MIDEYAGKSRVIGFFLLPAYLVYCEVVFKFLTVRTCPTIAWIPTVLFAVTVGLVLSAFTGVFVNQKANRITRGIIMCVIAILFLVNFFIYKQFKVFYEPSTVFVGAGGVATNFMDHVWKLIFSTQGMVGIALYLIPIILYFIFGSRIDSGARTSWAVLWRLGFIFVAITIVNISVVKMNPILNGTYSTTYNFQTAVTDFGLTTGVRLDIQRNALRSMGLNSPSIATIQENNLISSEEDEDSVEEGALLDEITETEESQIVYGKSVMDIDFNKLARETTNPSLAAIDAYVASLRPSSKNEYTGIFKGKNLILITAEAFSEEIIDPDLTPTLYRLATKGINFTDYTQQASAGTIGGEYQSIFGLFPAAAGESFINMRDNLNWFTMGSQLTREGYSGRAFHNGEVEYYDRNITHNTIGYPDEYMARGNGMEDILEPYWPGSDREMLEGTLAMYIDKQPFNLYYMTISGHSMYDFGNAMAERNWAYVEHLDMSERLKCYYAANMEIEFGLASIVDMLEKKGIADDTVIVLTSDHFPYGLDDDGYVGDLPYLAELYGYEPQNYLERDKNKLIIWCGEMEDRDPIVVDTPVCSLDILPTLSNLFGLDWDSRLLPGRDVFSEANPLVFNFGYDWKTDKGTYIVSRAEFTPVDGAEIPPGYVDRINNIVIAKMDYCWNVMKYDYYRHVLEDSGYMEHK